ncbi:hypothetical protein CONPUDRAFT_86097 [Coniophora puteana RWD-64-598 SS2]|uniref:Proteophosphoglycan ppg4 n=1 Tax=Coniophora puteana (strain RWD-64-598) TaxID=741705 RepID=R7SCS2_CONPW|nr:uncharacterized protein CONPUDRAFT_86097 [Coniophora puteana RWD-64-598 SS2]EIW73958.1 hypothetical protein CONPUDRAFT_86097 [Coniophora puteana RWD-64-598 SS2]
MSQQHSTPATPLPPSRGGESPIGRPSFSPQPRPSDGSEGYPSWLPKRPPPPAPASTLHSVAHGMYDSPEPEPTYTIGRKPTPRSVRMVNLPTDTGLHGDRREPTDQTRVPSNPRHSRVWSRITSAGRSPTLASALHAQERLPRPRLRAVGLHPELVRNPSILAHIYFYLLPLFTFYHVPLQTFFDFNAVFILLEVAKYPNPSAPGVPGSGKNWALGAAAYIASWAVWIFIVTIMYEVIYSFYRRWRVKRPLLVPLYLSTSAFNLASMTSYSHFSLMQHIRWSAFFGESGSIRDGLAETFWWYSQNLPTVALLLPRAGLCLALLFAFSFPNPEYVSLLDAGASNRDDTYFRSSDGTLTDYSRGVLIANAAWAAWRILLLILSWFGLWVVSGHGCAGLCGPRNRWEEEDAEKTVSIYGDNYSFTNAFDALPWDWRAGTRLRVQHAYEFCLTTKPGQRWSSAKKEEPDMRELLGVETTPAFDTDQIMAAVYPQQSHPRRPTLSEDLFQRPPKAEGIPATPSPDIVPPKLAKRRSRDREEILSAVYPFTAHGAQISSKDGIPFPPSPSSRKEKQSIKSPSPRKSHSISEFGEISGLEAEEEGDIVDEEAFASSDAHPRTSGSLSSLGHPIASRYPFQFRWPNRGGTSSSSSRGGHTHTHSTDNAFSTVSSNSRSAPSRATQSTGNAETSSNGPSHGHSTSMSSSSYGNPIPMPPRHPTAGRGRARAGTVPTTSPMSSSSAVVYTGTVLHGRIRTDSDPTDDSHGPYGPYGSYSDAEEEEEGIGEDEMEMMEQPIPEGPQEAAEGEDSVGLLRVNSRSPRGSLVSSGRSRRRRARTSSMSNSGSGSGSNSKSGSGSNSRTSSHSRPSLPPRSRAGSAVRSRTQSLIQSLGAASRSSVDVVQAIRERARTNSSRARLEDDYVYSSDAPTRGTHSRSGSDALSSGQENYTFGRPMLPELRGPYPERRLREVKSDLSGSVAESRGTRRHTDSLVSEAPSQATQISQAATEHPPPRPPRSPKRLSAGAGAIPIPGKADSAGSSKVDVSTAPASFVTGSATIAGSSDTGEHAAHPEHWADTSHMIHRDHHGPGPV